MPKGMSSHTRARRVAAVALTAALIGVGLVPAASAAGGSEVEFTDSDLAACVRQELGISAGAPITALALAGVTFLDCEDSSPIGSLVGLEHATKLQYLDLYGVLATAEGDLTDDERAAQTDTMLAPLEGLDKLALLDISGTAHGAEYDLGVLSTLTDLTNLYVSALKNHDLTPVAAIPHLADFAVENAHLITDITPLANSDALVSLTMIDLAAADLDPLADIPTLSYVALPGAQASALPSFADHQQIFAIDVSSSGIADLGDFSGSGLSYLDASGSALASLASLAGATNLAGLYVDDTTVSDLSPLQGATELAEFSAARAKIADLSALSQLAALESLDVDNNAIDDARPISQMAALTHWTAENQVIPVAPIPACTATDLTGVMDVDGTVLTPNPTSGTAKGHTVVVPSGHGTISYYSPHGKYSAMQVMDVAGGEHECAWPAGWLPTASFPGSLDLYTQAKVTFASGGSLPNYQPIVTWTDVDGNAPTISDEAYTPGYSDLGVSRRIDVSFWGTGMQTVHVAGPVLTVTGHFSEYLGFNYVNQLIAGTDATVDVSHVGGGTTATCAWKVNGAAISSGTNCNLSLPVSWGGKSIAVDVTLTAPNYVPKTYSIGSTTILKTLGALDWVGRINENSLTDIGDPGTKLVSTPPSFTLAQPTSYSYQWTRNGIQIPGATSSTYVVTIHDAGAKIGLRFTAHRTGYYSAKTDAIDVFTVRKKFTSTPAPLISGNIAVGYTVTANAGAWSPSAALSYQWYRDGYKISGATKLTYKLATDDAGARLTVKVTAKKSGYTTTVMSSAGATVLRRLTSTPVPTISGTAKIKSKLSLHVGTWLPGTVTKTYQWYRNGAAIAGATKSTYVTAARDAFASITVKVTGKKAGYLTVTKTSNATVPSGISYASCDALLLDYPGGVAKSAATVDLDEGVAGAGILATTYASSKLYALNAARDADGDGWACEPS